MKSNVPLQNSIQFNNPAQKVWYAAHVLKSALTSSPAIQIRAAQAAIPAKAAVLAQTAKPARASTPLVAGTANTTGYAFGALYLNSPAYPIGTAIPAIGAKPASAAVAAVAAVVAVPAITALNSPAIAAVKGFEDAISIVKTPTSLTVTVDLPVYRGVGVIGSNKVAIGEITPSALQANAWLDSVATPPNTCGNFNVDADLATDTLEQFLYKNALLCAHTITDIVRSVNGVMTNCKRLAITLLPSGDFDPLADSLQLSEVIGSI